MDTRVARCRMLRAKNNQCTAEALDAEGEVLICMEHAARVLELLKRAGAGPLLAAQGVDITATEVAK